MKHLKHVIPCIKYTWSYSMVFVTYMLIRNLPTNNSYLWWPFNYWIEDHTFEAVIVLAVIAFMMPYRKASKRRFD